MKPCKTAPAKPMKSPSAAGLLPKLAMRGTYLRALPGQDRLGLFSPRNKFSSPVLKLHQHSVDKFLSQGLLQQKKDGEICLSPAGAAWLKRRRSIGDAFRAQHQNHAQKSRDIGGGVHQNVKVNLDESPLAWLHQRRDSAGNPLITDYQFQAGERLREDFWRAQMTPRVTASWNMSASGKRARRGVPGVGVELADAVIGAKNRVRRSLEAVGPELAGVLIDVCCHLNGLKDVEKSSGWPQRTGKVILLLALTRLARHYGLVSEPEVARPLMRRIQHWGSHDYRPTLEAWQEPPSSSGGRQV